MFNLVAIGEDPKIKEPGFSHIIPDAILTVQQSNGHVEIIGDGQQVRCFIHAADAAEAVRRMILNPVALSLHLAHHEAMDCLGQMIWESQRAGRPPDGDAYIACVQRHATLD